MIAMIFIKLNLATKDVTDDTCQKKRMIEMPLIEKGFAFINQ